MRRGILSRPGRYSVVVGDDKGWIDALRSHQASPNASASGEDERRITGLVGVAWREGTNGPQTQDAHGDPPVLFESLEGKGGVAFATAREKIRPRRLDRTCRGWTRLQLRGKESGLLRGSLIFVS